MKNDQSFLEAALFRTMTLLASLNAAAEIKFGMRERKAGRDPSFDEDESVAIPVLNEELQVLKTLVFQLRSSLAIVDTIGDEKQEVEELSQPVNRFIDLMRLEKAGTSLQSIHQRLLSLYPTIDENLAEQARVLKNTAAQLKEQESDNFLTALIPFVDDLELFTHDLAKIIEA